MKKSGIWCSAVIALLLLVLFIDWTIQTAWTSSFCKDQACIDSVSRHAAIQGLLALLSFVSFAVLVYRGLRGKPQSPS